MNALVITSRFPWPAYSGDRLRATIWIEALLSCGRVTLVAPAGNIPQLPGLDHVRLRRSLAAATRSGARAMFRRLPRQALLAGGFDWDEALGTISRTGFDAAVVVLTRCDPWLEDRLPAKRRILDAVDSMSASAEERARAGSFPGRRFWLRDQRRSEQWESTIADRYDGVVAVSDAERMRIDGRVTVIPNGVEVMPESVGQRRHDFAFWGNLEYFANVDAVNWLLDEIWPRIRQEAPEATLLIAGSDAPNALLRRGGRDGITVLSPMKERAAILREVKIALLPLRFGSGVSNKVLEAGEASCAIAGTSIAFRGLEDIANGQVMEDHPGALAACCLALLRGQGAVPAAWIASGRHARDVVVRSHDREDVRRRMVQLASPSA